MLNEIPADIQRIIRALLIQRMDVTGPTRSDGRTLYFVNGHSLSEDELRVFSQKQMLTSWDILNHTRSGPAKAAGNGIMKFLLRSRSERHGFSGTGRTKLLWCKRFHRTWRRRVAILPSEESLLRYEVRCLRCGVADVEIIKFQKTKASS